MTAARLSPAASLLRNSKLFALPPAIALPNPEPSSEPVPRSDTATSIYPTRAAIETTLTSLGKGDWGFKRALPLKSTTKSGSPSVRLNRGIDTAEHIADFDSAADHVLTLKKFQELNQSIQHPRDPGEFRTTKVHHGAFRKGYDNTTNLSLSSPAQTKYTGVWPSVSPGDLQKRMPDGIRSKSHSAIEEDSSHLTNASVTISEPHRWRFGGPSLVQMSGLEFDQWIRTLDAAKRQSFREYVKKELLADKRSRHAVTAQEEARVGEVDPATIQLSEEEVASYLRKLRQQPRKFGSLIAAFLDLPEGPVGQSLGGRTSEVWHYGRNILSSTSYSESGPPRTHPSAGLSYIHNDRWTTNHAIFGPQDRRQPTVARQVKTRARGPKNVSTVGVAGFIVNRAESAGFRESNLPAFEPQPGGQKTVVRPIHAEVDEKGALKLVVTPDSEYKAEGEKAVHNSMLSNPNAAATRLARGGYSRVMEPLTRSPSRMIDYKKRDDIASGSSDNDFDFLDR